MAHFCSSALQGVPPIIKIMMSIWRLTPFLLPVFLANGALAGPLAVPPFPSPLPAMGINIRDAMSQRGLGAYDPIVLLRKDTGSATTPPDCSSVGAGYESHTFDGTGLSTGSSGGSTDDVVKVSDGIKAKIGDADKAFAACIDSRAGSGGYLNDLKQWLNLLAGAVLAQFAGPGASDYIFGDKKALYLGELLDGLCQAWGSKDSRLIAILANSANGITANYLGDTICSFSKTYSHILEVIRAAYLYGDQAVNTFISKTVQGFVRAILEQPINELKAEVIKAYNSLPFAAPLASFAKDAEAYVAKLSADVLDAIVTNARSRTNPYVDSTVAWLVSEGARLMQEAESASATVTALGGGTGTGTEDPALKLPPDKLAVVMASASPRVLEQLQALGERQEALRTQIKNRAAAMKEEGSKAAEEAEAKASARSGARSIDPEVASKLVEQSKQMTDERSLLIQLIEVNHVLASEQIRQEKRIEAMLSSMVEQAAMTNHLLFTEANKEIEAQIQALEEVKQQVLDAALTYASEITQAASVMDGVVGLIGSLGVERAGIVLTQEEYERLVDESKAIPVP